MPLPLPRAPYYTRSVQRQTGDDAPLSSLNAGDRVLIAGSELRLAWFHEKTVALYPAQDAGPEPHNLRYYETSAVCRRS